MDKQRVWLRKETQAFLGICIEMKLVLTRAAAKGEDALALAFEEAARRLRAQDASFHRSALSCRSRLAHLAAALDGGSDGRLLQPPFPELVQELAAALPPPALVVSAPAAAVAALEEEEQEDDDDEMIDSSSTRHGEGAATGAGRWDKAEVYLVAILRTSLGLAAVEDKAPMWQELASALSQITGNPARTPTEVQGKWKQIKGDYKRFIQTPTDNRLEKCPFFPLLTAVSKAKEFYANNTDVESVKRAVKMNVHKKINLNVSMSKKEGEATGAADPSTA